MEVSKIRRIYESKEIELRAKSAELSEREKEVSDREKHIKVEIIRKSRIIADAEIKILHISLLYGFVITMIFYLYNNSADVGVIIMVNLAVIVIMFAVVFGIAGAGLFDKKYH
nr:hypothetical protein [Lachnospiraceae bacterium]